MADLVTKQSPNYHLSNFGKSVERPNGKLATVCLRIAIRPFDRL